MYETQPCHVPQLLLEMKGWSCAELWLLCGTAESVTVMRCYADTNLTSTLLETANDLYGPDKPSVPTRLHPRVPFLKKGLHEYITTHTSFFCKAPSLRGEFGTLKISDVCQSAYAVTPNLHVSEACDKDVDFDTAVVSSETMHFFQNTHTVLRTKTSEIVVFMATNKDRMIVDSVGYSFPVAYAMKGSTMTNADLRYMTNALRDEFAKRSIPILAEVYDRQLHQFITSNADGKSLTKLCWRHNWQEVSNFSKQKCLNSMIEGCEVRTKDLELVEQSRQLEDGEEYSMGNININAKILAKEVINGKLCIRSLNFGK